MTFQDEPLLGRGLTHTVSHWDGIFNVASLSIWLKVGGLWMTVVFISITTLFWSGSICLHIFVDDTCDSIQNYMVQQLTVLFTLISLYALPVRTARILGLFGESKTGYDFHGRITPRPGPRSLMTETYDPFSFYHISYGPRCLIATLQFVSAIAQFIDQVFHLKYASWASSQSMPGLFWDNLFFLTSLITMLSGLAFEAYFDRQVRRDALAKDSLLYKQGCAFAPVASPFVLLRGFWCCYSAREDGYLPLVSNVVKPSAEMGV
jgi:hypothetical protein